MKTIKELNAEIEKLVAERVAKIKADPGRKDPDEDEIKRIRAEFASVFYTRDADERLKEAKEHHGKAMIDGLTLEGRKAEVLEKLALDGARVLLAEEEAELTKAKSDAKKAEKAEAIAELREQIAALEAKR